MALEVEITRLLPLYPRGVFFQWDLLGATEDGSYTFDVERSGSPEGPWESLVSGASDIFNYRDDLPVSATPPPYSQQDVNQLSMLRQLFYRVTVTTPSGVKASKVSPVEPRLTGKLKLVRRKILRDEAVLLRKLNGVEVAVCKRRHWGTRCTDCYDKYTREIVRANCITCYGTGYVGGYYDPIITMARRLPIPDHKDLTDMGNVEVRTTQLTMLDVPHVAPDDILVFLQDNKRFIVKDVGSTEMRTVKVHQTLTVSELARSNIEYRILVDPLRSPPLF